MQSASDPKILQSRDKEKQTIAVELNLYQAFLQSIQPIEYNVSPVEPL